MNFEVPPGLTEMLQDFTIIVLRTHPENLEAFAADYFVKLNERVNGFSTGGSGLRFEESVNVIPDDEEVSMLVATKHRGRHMGVSAEGYDPEADNDEDYTKVFHPKSDEQRKRLNEAIKNILLFRSLDKEQMQEVVDAMFEKTVSEGDEIITQGEDGDNFYVIDSGKYEIMSVDVDGKKTSVGSYNNDGFFGELALMYNLPRAVTIVASGKGSVWGLDRQTFRHIVLKSAFMKRKKYEKLLEGVTILKSLDAYERMNVCDALTSSTFNDGQKIIAQGESADCMFFVEEGVVRITVVDESDTTDIGEKEISRVGVGGYFGELALVTNKPRAATVYAIGTTKCAVLDVNAFERLMGPCMNIMKRNIEEYEAQLVQVFGKYKSNVSDLRIQNL